jgi:hypothetical protein
MFHKDYIKELLINKDFYALAVLAGKNTAVFKHLIQHLYDPVEPLRWQALEALGFLVEKVQEIKPGYYRNLLSRFLWAMNDESGNVPWGAPEAMGVIIAAHPQKYGDLTPMLITTALENPILHPGLLWAVAIIAEKDQSLIDPFLPDLLPLLSSPNPVVQGYALWFFKGWGIPIPPEVRETCLKKEEKITIFWHGTFHTHTLADLAR